MSKEELPFPFLLDEANKRPRNLDGTVGNRTAPAQTFAPEPDPEPEPQPDPKPKSIPEGMAIDSRKVAPLLEKVRLASTLVRQAGLDPNSTGGGIIAASIVEQLVEAPAPNPSGVPALTAMANKLKTEREKGCEPKAAHIDRFS